MEYQFLTEEEQHDMLVQYAAAQERDHYLHTVNLARFETILADAALTPTFRSRVEQLRKETTDRLHEVTHLLEKTRAQFPDATKVHAAHARLIAQITRVLR